MIEKIFNNSLYKNHREMMLCFFDLCIVFVSFLLAYWIKIEFRIQILKNLYKGLCAGNAFSFINIHELLYVV